jgi:hypothetical protein
MRTAAILLKNQATVREVPNQAARAPEARRDTLGLEARLVYALLVIVACPCASLSPTSVDSALSAAGR